MQFSLRSFKSTIPANGQVDFAVYGDKVFAVNVPDGIKIKFDNGEAVLFRTGIRFGVNGWFVSMLGKAINALSSVPTLQTVAARLASAFSAQVFDKISIINTTAAAAEVEFLAGFGDVSDDSTIVENAITISGAEKSLPIVVSPKLNNGLSGQTVLAPYGSKTIFQPGQGMSLVQNLGDGDINVYPASGQGFITLKKGETFSWYCEGTSCYVQADGTGATFNALVWKVE